MTPFLVGFSPESTRCLSYSCKNLTEKISKSDHTLGWSCLCSCWLISIFYEKQAVDVTETGLSYGWHLLKWCWILRYNCWTLIRLQFFSINQILHFECSTTVTMSYFCISYGCVAFNPWWLCVYFLKHSFHFFMYLNIKITCAVFVYNVMCQLMWVRTMSCWYMKIFAPYCNNMGFISYMNCGILDKAF